MPTRIPDYTVRIVVTELRQIIADNPAYDDVTLARLKAMLEEALPRSLHFDIAAPEQHVVYH